MKWLSLEDKLPKINDPILACNDDGVIQITKIIRIEQMNQNIGRRIYFEKCGATSFKWWMPLPDPAKEVEKHCDNCLCSCGCGRFEAARSHADYCDLYKPESDE